MRNYPKTGRRVEAPTTTSQLRSSYREDALQLEQEIRRAIGWLARQLSPRVQPRDLIRDVADESRWRDASLTTLLALLVACMRHPAMTPSLLVRFGLRCWVAIVSYRPLLEVQSIEDAYAEDTHAEARANIDQALLLSAHRRADIARIERAAESTLEDISSSLSLLFSIRRLRAQAKALAIKSS